MKAILIDDERLARQELKNLLASHKDIEVVAECSDATQAKEKINELKPDIIFCDIQMPGKNGFDVLRELKEKKIQVKVIVLTAYADVKSAIDSAKLGATDFISKPYDFDELLITIRKVLQRDT